jgi:outer membrane biosynthesis protein TonB
MTEVGRRVQVPETLQFIRANHDHVAIEENRARILELHTEAGVVYACPSLWQRIGLQWTFRHFHSLPIEVLSRREQRLIEKLSRSAMVSPHLQDKVFAVVELVRSSSAKSADRVVNLRTQRATIEPSIAKPRAPDLQLSPSERLFLERSIGGYLPPAKNSGSAPVRDRDAGKPTDDRKRWVIPEARLQQFAALSVLFVICVALELARIYGISLLPVSEQPTNHRTASALLLQVFTPTSKLAGNPGTANAIQPREISSPKVPPLRVRPATVTFSEKEKSQSMAAAEVTTARHNAAGRSPQVNQPSKQSPNPAPNGSLMHSGDQSSDQLLSSVAGKTSARSREESGELADQSSSQTGNPSERGVEQFARSAASSAAPSNSEPAVTVASTPPKRLFVSELPQGHFAYPLAPQRNLFGELQLRALIGIDGAVKEVRVLSGDPKLAEAGVSAVRRWHYNPYQAVGGPVEVETQIKMKFFGQDAVSILSVPNKTVSELR